MLGGQFKTVILLALLTALLLWVGSLWSTTGLVVAAIFVVLMNLGSYWFSDKVVLMMYRAREAKESEYPDLHSLVSEIAQRANLPKPKVYVIDSPVANAFATGRNPKHAAIAVTKGIMDLLTADELKGVLSHEAAHIKNRDILISTVAGTIAGVISYVAAVARWSAIFGFGGKDRDNNLLELLALAIITPLIATLIQLAISRSREYIADTTGSRFLHSGLGLASALEKLQSHSKRFFFPLTGTTQATAHLFITNPLKGAGLMHLLSTHPSTHERIRRLRSQTF